MVMETETEIPGRAPRERRRWETGMETPPLGMETPRGMETETETETEMEMAMETRRAMATGTRSPAQT